MGSLVRWVLEEVNPVGVAVELPTTFTRTVYAAVSRLPRISVVISEEPGEDALLWVVAPGDPYAEVLRWAQERDRASWLVDPDIRYVHRHQEAIPDPYAMWQMGPAQFLGAIATITAQGEVTPEDLARERGMAFHIQNARAELSERDGGEGGELLVLIGAAHVMRLIEYLKEDAAQPLARTRRSHVELRHLHPDALTALLSDAPWAHGAYEIIRSGRPDHAPDSRRTVAPRLTLYRQGLSVISRQGRLNKEERLHALSMDGAYYGARLLKDDFWVVDRARLGKRIWSLASRSYTEQTQESLQGWQHKIFDEYTRRHARIQGNLVASTYEWVVAGRGVSDDNLAWEIFAIAKAYPWQGEDAEIPVARLDGELLDLGTRKIRFRRRFFKTKQRLVRVPVRERPDNEDPEDWLKGFDSNNIVSFPPEDLVLEDYGHYLQKKAVSRLATEKSRTEVFSSSMLDGLDIRETIRNIHQGKIYVKERGRVPGAAGSVVIIFDRDLKNLTFPHCMTWIGEHNQESDLAFYSTAPNEQVVGPGIMRSTYGGLMLSWPPFRLHDIWNDPDYHIAREKAEVLTMAAIDYSLEPLVVHVAKDAPTDRMKQYASRRRRILLHVPLGSLSPRALKKLRVVHLLAGQDKRSIAKQYIW